MRHEHQDTILRKIQKAAAAGHSVTSAFEKSVSEMNLFVLKNKVQKSSENPQKQLKSVLQAYSVNMLVVRANRGVRTTYLSCSCDISVGRTGLSSWY